MARFLPFCRETWTSLSTADLDKNDAHVVVRLVPCFRPYQAHAMPIRLTFSST